MQETTKRLKSAFIKGLQINLRGKNDCRKMDKTYEQAIQRTGKINSQQTEEKCSFSPVIRQL